jgi:tRNA pseudouridine38-40 synthase
LETEEIHAEVPAAVDEAAAMPEATEVCCHLSVAYCGTAYCGWQLQPDRRTVQGELLDRLRRMLRAPELRIYGSSRTDSGVHALDQQVTFHVALPDGFTIADLQRRLNRWLPDDIVVKSARLAEPEVHARFSNCGKAYTYCLAPGFKVNPLYTPFVWRTPRALDVAAMQAAAAIFQGEHDFASFAVNPGKEVGSTVRNLRRLEVIPTDDGMVYVNAVGDSFLYKMVRSLVGYLVHVGYGYATADDARRVLEAKDRSQAADSAPAQGLFLAKVFFDHEAWHDYTPTIPPFAWQARL